MEEKQLSLWEKTKMNGHLMMASRTLLENFLMLFLKKYDTKQSPDFKKKRDFAEKVIFATSIAGKMFAFALILKRLSFLNGITFNPIRDLQTGVVAYTSLVLSDSIPLIYFGQNLRDLFIVMVRVMRKN